MGGRSQRKLVNTFLIQIGDVMATLAKKSTTRSRKTANRKSKTQTAKKRTAKVTSRGSSGTIRCPECGKTFERAAALGAHRSRAHGVAGSSAGAVRNRKTSSTRRGGRKATTASGATTRRKTTTARTRARRSAPTRDTLLGMLFPRGIPANVETVERVNAWLDEAESLSRLG